MTLTLLFHYIGDQLPDLPRPHHEHVAVPQVQQPTFTLLGLHRALRHHDVVLFGQAGQGDQRASHECLVLDFPVKGFLSSDMEHAGNLPLYIVGETGEHPGMIAPAECLQILLNHFLFPPMVFWSLGPVNRADKSVSPAVGAVNRVFGRVSRASRRLSRTFGSVRSTFDSVSRNFRCASQTFGSASRPFCPAGTPPGITAGPSNRSVTPSGM